MKIEQEWGEVKVEFWLRQSLNIGVSTLKNIVVLYILQLMVISSDYAQKKNTELTSSIFINITKEIAVYLYIDGIFLLEYFFIYYT